MNERRKGERSGVKEGMERMRKKASRMIRRKEGFKAYKKRGKE